MAAEHEGAMEPVIPSALRQKHVVCVADANGRRYVVDRHAGDWTTNPAFADHFYALHDAAKVAARVGGFALPLREAMELDTPA